MDPPVPEITLISLSELVTVCLRLIFSILNEDPEKLPIIPPTSLDPVMAK